MRRAGCLVRETREVRRCPPPQGDGRRPAIPPVSSAKLPGGRGCGERRAHTRAHTPREHAQCGPRNFLPSREPPGPLPAPGLQSWGWRGARVGGAAPACRPFVSPSSFPALPLLDPKSFSCRQPPRLGTEAWMSYPAPQSQVRGRVAGGLAVRPPAGCACSPCASQAYGPCAVSRLGGRGCVSGGTLAHTLAVTHKAVVS